MDEIYRKKYIYHEGWTEQELESYAQKSKFLAIISVILSLIILILPFILYSQFQLFWLIIVIAVLSIILAGIVVLWSRSFTIDKVEDDKLGNVQTINYNKQQSIVILLLSFTLICLNIMTIILLIYNEKTDANQYIAKYSEHQAQSYKQTYSYIIAALIPLLILNTLIQSVFAFSTYITIQDREYLLILIYTFDLFFIITTILAMYFIYHSLQLSTLPNIPKPSSALLNVAFWECIFVIIFLAIPTYFINYFRKQTLYFVIGSLILITIFAIAGTQFLLFRQAQSISTQYNNDCPQQLRNTHSSYLLSDSQCQKYKDSTNCPQNQLALTWEKEQSKLQCLNLNCCGAMSDSYSFTYFAAAFSMLALLFTGLGLTVSLFQISTKFNDFYIVRHNKDYFFIGLLILVTIFAFILFAAFPVQLPRQQNAIIPQEDEIFVKVNKNPIVYPKNWQGVTGCQPLVEVYGKQFQFNNCQQSDCSQSDGVRVSLLAQGITVLVTKYINSPDIMYIQPQLAQQLLFPGSTNDDGFLSVQGSYYQVAEFLNNYVQLCTQESSKTVLNKDSIQVNIYYLELPKAITEKDQKKQDKTKRKLIDQYIQKSDKHLHFEDDNYDHDDDETSTQEPEPFTKEQNDYLNSIKFSDLKLEVIDITNSNKVEEVEITFYKKLSDCGKLNAIPNRIISSNKDGELVMLNMMLKEYHIGVIKGGYYSYCNSYTLKEKPQPLKIQLVPKNKHTGQFTILLQSPIKNSDVKPAFIMNLGATYQDNKANCLVGFYNNECGGMNFYNSQDSQVIQVNQLVKTVYTFFVQFLNVTQVTDNSQIFDDMMPTVTLYAHEQNGPIVTYKLPTDQKNIQLKQKDLVWLALCLDGNVGDITQASPQKFWDYADENKTPEWWQRNYNDESVLPSSQICSAFYKKEKK